MLKDKIKGVFGEVYKELEDAYEDVQEKVDNSKIFDKIKDVGEEVLEEVEKANIGEKIKKVGEELKAELMPEAKEKETTGDDGGEE